MRHICVCVLAVREYRPPCGSRTPVEKSGRCQESGAQIWKFNIWHILFEQLRKLRYLVYFSKLYSERDKENVIVLTY